MIPAISGKVSSRVCVSVLSPASSVPCWILNLSFLTYISFFYEWMLCMYTWGVYVFVCKILLEMTIFSFQFSLLRKFVLISH